MKSYIMDRKSLKKHCEMMCERYKGVPESGSYSEHAMVLDLLEKTESKWIKFNPRDPKAVPDSGLPLWVTTKAGRVYETRFLFNSFMLQNPIGKNGEAIRDEVVAWMYWKAPEPYKGE